jgi:hypothetical protein
MRTIDFTSSISSKQLNESMFKKFGVKVNFDKYDRAQLENFRNLLRTKLHQTETSSNFNALLSNESYQKDKFMVDLLNTRIKEMLGEAKLPMKTVNGKKVPKFAADGKGKNDITKNKKTKEGLDPVGKEDGDVNNDGKKNKSDDYLTKRRAAVAKAIAGKKGTKIKEGKAGAHEMAHHYAVEYMKAHRQGNLELAQEMKDSCEGYGGKLSHGGMGEAFHTHHGMNNGQPYKCEEGQMGEMYGPYDDAKVDAINAANPPRTPSPVSSRDPGRIGGPAIPVKHHSYDRKSVASNISGDDSAAYDYRGQMEEGKKLSAKQKKVMDKDHDDDIDAKDLAKLRKENMSKKQKAGITESIARYIAEDEEGKAKSITAGLDMVNDFTSWMQRIATYQTKSMIELSDEIRAHFGDAEAQTFKQETYAALEQSLTALTQSREQLSNAVAVLAGEAPAQEPMGSDPMASPDDMSMQEPGMEEPEALPAPDEFASADAAAGGPETTGRMKRESIERGNRLMKILGA